MKKVSLFLFACTLVLMSFTKNTPVPHKITISKNAAPIVWKSDAIEVGSIPQGVPKKIQFEFKNTSKKAILIKSVKPSCGCTAAEYTKTPVAPGKSGYIKATFNALATGPFTKTVTVFTSADKSPTVLKFAGVVAPKK
ncbi:MAG: hypothetical protein RLZZ231_1503 [Bacteroidota bacterium]|jgi:hypothetical protein